MRYMNLQIALQERRGRLYELANWLRVSPSWLSHRLHSSGPSAPDLEPHQKTRIGELLGYSATWLFQEVRPPASARLAPKGGPEGSRG